MLTLVLVLSQFIWERNPNWSHYYASAPEIWQYFKDVATKYNLEQYVKFSHRVESARWDDEQGLWILSIVTPDGSVLIDQCEILVNGTGVLK